MQKSGSGRRIGAFFLDSLIFTFGAGIIISIFEDPTYTENLLALEQAFMEGTINYLQYTESIANLVDPNLGIKQIVNLILAIGYFIILPIFWEKQTVGRLACKIKVVKENGEKATPVNFILREGFGQTLFASLLTILATFANSTTLSKIDSAVTTIFGFILIIGFFMMLGSKKTTIYDRISKTIVVLNKPVEEPDELDIEIKKEAEISDEDIIDL